MFKVFLSCYETNSTSFRLRCSLCCCSHVTSAVVCPVAVYFLTCLFILSFLSKKVKNTEGIVAITDTFITRLDHDIPPRRSKQRGKTRSWYLHLRRISNLPAVRFPARDWHSTWDCERKRNKRILFCIIFTAPRYPVQVLMHIYPRSSYATYRTGFTSKRLDLQEEGGAKISTAKHRPYRGELGSNTGNTGNTCPSLLVHWPQLSSHYHA